MRNRIAKKLFVAIVLAFGIFASAFGSAEAKAIVTADTEQVVESYDVSVNSSNKTINKSHIYDDWFKTDTCLPRRGLDTVEIWSVLN